MEVSMAASRGAVIPPCSSFRNNEIANPARQVAMRRPFCDRSHKQSYGGAVKIYCGKIEKIEKLEKQKMKGLAALYDGSLSEKRRIKLLELVSKDLSALSSTFAEGEEAQKSLAEEVRGQIFTDALQVLTTQLEQVKAERKQRKQEKKAQKAALKAQKKLLKKEAKGDSSSSESSDSECEVVDTARLSLKDLPSRTPDADADAPQVAGIAEVANIERVDLLHSELAERANRLGLSRVDEVEGVKQVQVCMGGKCKKLGSEQLLAAFEERIAKSGMGCGVEAVGCKCMGKCRNAPNVRVQNDFSKELHMGVTAGDVDLIVGHHFGLAPQEKREMNGSDLVRI